MIPRIKKIIDGLVDCKKTFDVIRRSLEWEPLPQWETWDDYKPDFMSKLSSKLNAFDGLVELKFDCMPKEVKASFKHIRDTFTELDIDVVSACSRIDHAALNAAGKELAEDEMEIENELYSRKADEMWAELDKIDKCLQIEIEKLKSTLFQTHFIDSLK